MLEMITEHVWILSCLLCVYFHKSNSLKYTSDLWKYARSRSGTMISQRCLCKSSCPKPEADTPNVFANFFASVYGFQAENCSPHLPEGNVSDLHDSIVVDDEIGQVCIKKLKRELAAWHDDIPAALVKMYSELITPLLHDIFNSFFKAGVFPGT